MPLLRKGSVRVLLIAAAVLLALTLAGCGQGDSDKIKTVVVENDRISRAEAKIAATDLSGDWYGWWRMYDTSGDWAHM